VDKRSASTYTEIVRVDALRLSTLQQLFLTLNLMAVRRYVNAIKLRKMQKVNRVGRESTIKLHAVN